MYAQCLILGVDLEEKAPSEKLEVQLSWFRALWRVGSRFRKVQIIFFSFCICPPGIVQAFNRIMHGYQVEGMENIPTHGPAILVYYHGVFPLDWQFLIGEIGYETKRFARSLVAPFMFQVPGWATLNKALHLIPAGSVDSCTETLKQGHLLAIAPGGIRESVLSDSNYDLVWGKRAGFAKLAIKARCPIVPIFTRNLREAYRSVPLKKSWVRFFYDSLGITLMIPYGGFPVKLTTYIGEPIHFDPDKVTVEEVVEMVSNLSIRRALYTHSICSQTKQKLTELMDQYQPKPGSVLRALSERFYGTPPYKPSSKTR